VADGKWITYIDDDQWHPKKIEQQIDLGRKSCGGVIYSGVDQRRDERRTAIKRAVIAGHMRVS